MRPSQRGEEDDEDALMRQRFVDALTEHLAACAPNEPKQRAAFWAKDFFKAQVCVCVCVCIGAGRPVLTHIRLWLIRAADATSGCLVESHRRRCPVCPPYPVFLRFPRAPCFHAPAPL